MASRQLTAKLKVEANRRAGDDYRVLAGLAAGRDNRQQQRPAFQNCCLADTVAFGVKLATLTEEDLADSAVADQQSAAGS